MERTTSLERARQILGEDIIDFDRICAVQEKMGISIPDHLSKTLPEIPFSENELTACKGKSVLILGMPYYKDGTSLTVLKMYRHFGSDPDKSEPCFYNQDWYHKEQFANDVCVCFKWYLVNKELSEDSRGFLPDTKANNLPLAIECTYFFFLYNIVNGAYLWPDDYVWCSDYDSFGDMIYIGRYFDSTGKNKNGFSIHRHLSIKKNYGSIKIL